MVIKRMVGSKAIARELGRATRETKPERQMDSSFFMFGPAIWDGLDEDELGGLER